MIKRIAIANQKGGVSKTTTTHALGAGLGILGYKVLLIDLDPQANLSDNSGIDINISNTIYEVMKEEITAKEAIQKTKYFDIIPSNLNLASADLEFAKTGKEYILKERLISLESFYDFIIIDTPPALGILTVNAFTYVDDIIIPTNAGIFASSGIMQLYNSIETVKKYCNPKIKIDGILFTKFNARTVIATDIKEITEIISKKINTKVYNTQIRSSVMVDEAQANRMDIYSYDNNNNVSVDYMAFIKEYLESIGEEI